MGSEPRLNLDTESGVLGWLLFDVTRQLQLTPTQYNEAEQHYQAVGSYLESLDPRVRVLIFPHGSMALGTTVKPKGRDEFDLDFVCLVPHPAYSDPMALYAWLVDALKEHGIYRKMMEPLKRCVRLRYAGNFHMDILPARPDPAPAVWQRYSDTCILVPDTKLVDWSPSNPLGFRAWFEEQYEEGVLLSKRAQAPLPANEPAERKAVLQQVVQLVKRNRDVEFKGDDAAPRSVVLTTLAGEDYWGEGELYDGLAAVSLRIASRLPLGPMVVPNPTNPEEVFSEAWLADPASYGRFRSWFLTFANRIHRLPSLRGPALDEELKSLFGETVAQRARAALTERIQREREERRLRSHGTRLTTATGVGSVTPSNTFFGESRPRR